MSADTIAKVKRADRRKQDADSKRTPCPGVEQDTIGWGDDTKKERNKQQRKQTRKKKKQTNTFFHFGSSLLGADALLFGLNMFLSGIPARTF
jgi:hypothetical protein